MKQLNNTGKIKIAVLIILLLLNALTPTSVSVQMNLGIAIFVPLVFGAIALPILLKLNVSRNLTPPSWNDNPFTFSRPISFFHFVAFFLISCGIGILLSDFFKSHMLNSFAISSIFFGIGLLLGIQLALKKE